MTYAVIAHRLPGVRLPLRNAARLALRQVRQVEEVLVGRRKNPAPALASFSRDAQTPARSASWSGCSGAAR